MKQPRVEIKDYSITYFNCIAAFKAPYHWTSVKGGAHTHFIDSLAIHASMKRVWALPLIALRRFNTQWCDRNTQWNNLRFLHGTITYAIVDAYLLGQCNPVQPTIYWTGLDRFRLSHYNKSDCWYESKHSYQSECVTWAVLHVAITFLGLAPSCFQKSLSPAEKSTDSRSNSSHSLYFSSWTNERDLKASFF